MPAPIYYLAIGHVAQDLTPRGPRLGGSVAFAALTARALGYPPGVVTACADDLDLSALDGVSLSRQSASHTTTYENLYTPAGRTQVLRDRAPNLSLADVPAGWRGAPLVHLAPLNHELDLDLLAAFPDAQVGLTAQGWLRGWDAAGRVYRQAWERAEHTLARAAAAVLSIDDVGGDWELMTAWAALTPALVVTQGAAGCTVFARGQDPRHLPVQPQTEVDPTGAGDVFAAAFFVHLYETGDAVTAARLANTLAGFCVTRPGLEGAPTLDEVGLARVRAELA